MCPLHDESIVYQRRRLDRRFRAWLDGVPARRVAGIAGNHDFAAEQDLELMRSLPWTYLANEAVVHEGFGRGRLGAARWHNVSHVDDSFEPVHPPQPLPL